MGRVIMTVTTSLKLAASYLSLVVITSLHIDRASISSGLPIFEFYRCKAKFEALGPEDRPLDLSVNKQVFYLAHVNVNAPSVTDHFVCGHFCNHPLGSGPLIR